MWKALCFLNLCLNHFFTFSKLSPDTVSVCGDFELCLEIVILSGVWKF